MTLIYLILFHFLFSFFLWHCVCILLLLIFFFFVDVLSLVSSYLSFLLQVEVSLLVTGDALVKEVVAAQPFAALGVEKKPPSGGVAREARQAIKDAQPLSSPVSLAA